MKKIKIAMLASNLELNGISAVIMNYCRNIDLDKFEITIFAGNDINPNYRRELEKIGISIIQLPSKRLSKIKYYRALKNSMKRNYFDMIHVHGNSAVMAFDLEIAKLKGIKVRIAHSHNTVCPNMKLHKLLNPIFKRLYTNAFACGEEAGKWIFKNQSFEVINNGINVNKYTFDESIRNNVRKELNIKEDEILIGHIRKNKLSKKSDIFIRYIRKILRRRLYKC